MQDLMNNLSFIHTQLVACMDRYDWMCFTVVHAVLICLMETKMLHRVVM